MRIVFFGNNPRGAACLEKLISENEHIVAVVAHPINKILPIEGKNVKTIAEVHKISYIQPRKINEPENVNWLKSFKPDLFVLSGYNQILRTDILSIPKNGSINLHGGRLPQYRGVAPINWQIINGEQKGEAVILFVDEGIDTGDIIISEEYDISIDDTAKTILDKTLKIFPELLIKAIKQIKNGKVKAIKQNPEEGCYYARRYPRDGRIDWKNKKAFEIYNLIRALVNPYPGAFTYYKGQKVIIWKASLLKETIKGIPGRVVLKRKNGVVVTAIDKGLLIETVQPENGEIMNSMDILTELGSDFE